VGYRQRVYEFIIVKLAHEGRCLTVSSKQPLFRLGLAIYILSFFVVATGDPKGWVGRMRGYECAYSVSHAALTATPFHPNSDDYAPPFLYVSILISALINPIFLVHVALALLKLTPSIVRVLKFAVPSMIPFCWVVLHALEVYPREGHVFWVIGMLLVVFSGSKQIATQN
jgi:hypothetical protein